MLYTNSQVEKISCYENAILRNISNDYSKLELNHADAHVIMIPCECLRGLRDRVHLPPDDYGRFGHVAVVIDHRGFVDAVDREEFIGAQSQSLVEVFD